MNRNVRGASQASLQVLFSDRPQAGDGVPNLCSTFQGVFSTPPKAKQLCLALRELTVFFAQQRAAAESNDLLPHP